MPTDVNTYTLHELGIGESKTIYLKSSGVELRIQSNTEGIEISLIGNGEVVKKGLTTYIFKKGVKKSNL